MYDVRLFDEVGSWARGKYRLRIKKKKMSWSNTNKFSYDRWTRLSFFSPSILIISSIHSYTIALPFSLLPPFLPLLRFFYSHSRTMNTRIPCIKNNNYYNNIRIT